MSNRDRFLLEMNMISPRHLLQGYLEVRRVVLPSPPHPLVVLHLAEVPGRLSHGGSGPGSLEDTVLIRALVHWQRSGSGLATKKQDLWPCLPPSLGFGSGGARSGGSESPGPAGSRSSSVVWSTASFPLTNPPTLFWLHYSAYFSSTYRRYLDRPTYLRYGTEYQ